MGASGAPRTWAGDAARGMGALVWLVVVLVLVQTGYRRLSSSRPTKRQRTDRQPATLPAWMSSGGISAAANKHGGAASAAPIQTSDLEAPGLANAQVRIALWDRPICTLRLFAHCFAKFCRPNVWAGRAVVDANAAVRGPHGRCRSLELQLLSIQTASMCVACGPSSVVGEDIESQVGEGDGGRATGAQLATNDRMVEGAEPMPSWMVPPSVGDNTLLSSKTAPLPGDPRRPRSAWTPSTHAKISAVLDLVVATLRARTGLPPP